MSYTSVSSKKTSSGIVHTGECVLTSLLIGTDGVNDPVITIYDGVDNSGTEIIPTNTYDSSALGLNGAILPLGACKACKTGIYVEITCAGTVEVTIGYRERENWGVG